MKPSHFISAWLAQAHYLKSLQYIEHEPYDIKSFWLNIDASFRLDQAADVELIPFDTSRERCFDYVRKACDLIGRSPNDRPGRLSSDADSDKILNTLGQPPCGSYSIYLITVTPSDGTDERVVYVGKTNAETNRFRGGHAAISRLHHPDYDGLQKRIHFACISVINDDENTFPAEWMNPPSDRDKILSSIEYQLIYELQPELNDRGRDAPLAQYPKYIVTQNIDSDFLDAMTFGEDYFCP